MKCRYIFILTMGCHGNASVATLMRGAADAARIIFFTLEIDDTKNVINGEICNNRS